MKRVEKQRGVVGEFGAELFHGGRYRSVEAEVRCGGVESVGVSEGSARLRHFCFPFADLIRETMGEGGRANNTRVIRKKKKKRLSDQFKFSCLITNG